MSEWISVDERMPPDEIDVIVTGPGFRGQIYDIAGRFHDAWASHITQDECRIRVTHWMPMPVPYNTVE